LVQESERHYRALAESGRRDAWRRCAESELRLLHTGRAAPKTVAKCPLAVGKPRLDGQLEDDVWQGREPLELKSAQHDDANWAAAVLLAHDEQFLYVAASCGKAPGADYPASHDSRPRDPDLNDRDRIDLLLDLDRDYATFYRFTIDHRGWTGEACLGDRTWDPQWFVAAADDPQRWTVEAAIPLSELSAQPPKAGDVWAVGIQRTVPGVGFQSWTEPAAISPRPEGFGWLVFE
jgi:hypothetical protein